MSREIDEKIVEMRFENQNFEQNAQQSMSTLEKLKKALNMTGAAKSFEEIDDAAKKVSMSSLENGIESLNRSFSALEVMGITALANITNSAVNAGKKVVSALTIDPVKSGFQEYETQINAIQTILANTSKEGTTLSQVNAALDELNRYADKTIYNFTEMTRNIGTFTAAGVDLDTSVSAIKGIANLAAVSGSTSQQASTAMYQLSQALASGTVKLMDWNSVVNAGMGGQVFQDALKETALVHGIAIDRMIKQEGSFRETLKSGWLTSEILTETLNKFTGDLTESQLLSMGYNEEQIAGIVKMGQTANDAATKVKTFTQLFDTLKEALSSGWTQSWEIVIGDFEEAKELLTTISDVLGGVINKSAEARNNLLSGWKELGGRTMLIDAMEYSVQALLSVAKPIKKAFDDIFPATTIKQLVTLTSSIRKFTEHLAISEQTADNVHRTFKGFFAILDIGIRAVSAVAKGFVDFLKYILPVGDGVLSITASIGDFIVSLDETIKKTDIFNKAVSKINQIIKPVVDIIVNLVNSIINSITSLGKDKLVGIDDFVKNVKDGFSPLKAIGSIVSGVFSGLIKITDALSPVFFAIGDTIGNAVTYIINTIYDVISNFDFGKVINIINLASLSGILIGVKKLISKFSDVVGGKTGILGTIKEIIGGVTDSLKSFQDSLQAGTLKKIAVAVGILTLSIIGLSTIDTGKLFIALSAITVLFGELLGAFSIFTKILSGSSLKGTMRISPLLITMSAAILILSSALVKLSETDWEGLGKGLIGVAGLAAILVASAKTLSNSSKKLIKGATGLIAFAASIRILSGAVEEIGSLDTKALIQGLIGVGTLCVELGAFLKLADFDNFGVLKGIGLIALSEALNILSVVVKKFSEIDTLGMVQGLVAVGVLLTEIGAFVNLTSNAKHVLSTSIAMNALAAAMVVFSKAIADLGALSLGEIAKGLIAIAGVLTEVTIAMKFFPKNMVSSGFGMIEVAAAIVILGKALKEVSNISWEGIAKGLVALGGALLEIVVSMQFMKKALSGAAALLIVTAALNALVPVMQSLGSLSWGQIGKALIGIAGAFTIFGIAGLALTPIAPTLVVLSAAIALFGAGCAGVAAAVAAFSVALSTLAGAGKSAISAVVDIIKAIISLIPELLTQIGNGIVAFVKAVANGASSVVESFGAIATAVIVTVCKVITSTGPLIIETVINLIDNLLLSIANHAESIVRSLILIVKNIIVAVIKVIGETLGSVGKWIIDKLTGVATDVEGNVTPEVISSSENIASGYVKGARNELSNGKLEGVYTDSTEGVLDILGDYGVDFSNIGELDATALLDGSSDAMNPKEIGKVFSKFGNIGVSTIKDSESDFENAGENIPEAVAEGIEDNKNAPIEQMRQVITGLVKQTGKDAINRTNFIGENILLGVREGMLKKERDLTDTSRRVVMNIAGAMKDAAIIQSPSVLFKEEVGEYIVQGIAEGIKSDMSAEEAAAQKASNIADAFQEAMDKVSLDMDIIDVDWDKYAAAFDDVSEADDYFVKRAETLSKKITSQTEIVTLARNEYNTTLKEFGAASEYTKEAYIRMVQAETELVALQKELDDLSIEQYEKMIEAYNKKTDLINQRIDIIERERSLTEAMYGDAISEEASKYLGANSALKSYGKTLSKVKNLQEKYNAILKDEHATEEQINDAYGELLDARTDLVNLAGDFAASFGMNDIATSLLTNVTGAISALTTDPKLASVAKGVSTALTKVVGENAASGITNGVNKFFNGGGTDILANALTLASSIASGDAANAITASFQLVGSIAGSEFGQAVTSKVWKVLTSGDKDGFIGTVKNALNKAGGLFDSSGIKGIVSGIGQKIGSWLNKSTGAELSESGSGGGFLGTLKTVISKVAGKLNLSGIFEVISGIGSTIGSWLLKAFRGVLGGAGGLLDILKNVVGGIANFFTGGSNALQTIANVGADVGNAMKTGFTAMVGNGEATNGLAAVASKALGAVSSVTSGASASISGVLSGLASKFASLGGSITSMASGATAALGSFGTAGAIVAGGLAAQGGIHWGIGKLRDRLYEAKVAADQSGNSVKSFFLSAGNSFLKFVDSMTIPGAVKNIVDVGGNIIKGLGNGIVKAGNAVVNGVKKVGGWIVNGFKSFFGIHSPSTLMADLGIYIPMGLAKGIEDGSYEAVSSINTMGGTIQSAMSSLIEKMNTMTEDEMDLNPTITPVVDMSEVKTAGNNIGDILNKSTSIKDAVSMAAKNALRKGESIIATQNGGAAANGLSNGASAFGSQFIFNQYNTSPKSLSAIDIYRQTNNQFAYLKEMVNA